ncbi:hypothetical protein NEOLEDRAFT_1149455 [Neolentinus lepideus HHB14362 ss-1]|uniref:Uncharacterized protein n=1 Tax=Neolentinus lepideus HHB14362 ss-1 TaxID=1314782 RepID=A0A165R646_9AGAM|nr:hypothetical protein NEOLEDRAFT_1149455 [Neolentinus lepideus HHB14362 ss-1]
MLFSWTSDAYVTLPRTTMDDTLNDSSLSPKPAIPPNALRVRVKFVIPKSEICPDIRTFVNTSDVRRYTTRVLDRIAPSTEIRLYGGGFGSDPAPHEFHLWCDRPTDCRHLLMLDVRKVEELHCPASMSSTLMETVPGRPAAGLHMTFSGHKDPNYFLFRAIRAPCLITIRPSRATVTIIRCGASIMIHMAAQVFRHCTNEQDCTCVGAGLISAQPPFSEAVVEKWHDLIRRVVWGHRIIPLKLRTISYILYGIALGQFMMFFRKIDKTGMTINCLMDTLQQCLIIHALWFYLVRWGGGGSEDRYNSNWSLQAQAIPSVILTLTVQCFFAIRLWRSSERRWTFILFLPIVTAFDEF